MSGILSGVRVVEGSAFVAAPLAGMTLAQLGADVIRFDQIGGGLDYRLVKGIAWRLQGDGLITGFYGKTQTNFRLSTGLVFRF